MLINYNFQSMSLTNLIDLLAAYTTKYTQLLAEKNFGDEYNKVKETIKQLQAIIELRKELLTAGDMQDLNSTDQLQ
jgi:hypothetical protein